MTDKEEAVFEKQLSTLIATTEAKESAAPAAKKARKPYEWTEKRAEAFEKMRSGLAMKVEVTQQLKKEKRDLEKKAIKERIQKIMSTTKESSRSEKATKRPKGKRREDSSSEEEHIPMQQSSDEESQSEEELPPPRSSSSSKKHRQVEVKHPKKGQIEGKSKRKEKEVYVRESSSEESASEEESFEVASAKQKQHYRDSKLKLGKAQRSTRTLNALDNYILL